MQTPARAYEAKRNYFEQLQPLAPASYPLAQTLIDENHAMNGGLTSAQAIAALQPFMDYCVGPFDYLFTAQPHFQLSDLQMETIYRKEVLLEPDIYFALGSLLRQEGRVDEAAAADRKGVAQAFDQVFMSNSVQPLIEYDLAHGKDAEALALGKRAADVYSSRGIMAYLIVLEKFGRLSEAETWAKNMKERYNDDDALLQLYLSYPAHFHNQADALKKEYFPEGMTSASLNSFSGAPEKGAVFTSDSQVLNDAGLHQGDVVVALNSTKIESYKQYQFVRASLPGSDMDLIVWQNGQYRELHASPPTHHFDVETTDYPVR